MNRETMLKLLGQGMNPIDVSIQKWQDVVTDIKCGVELQDIDYGCKTCALCETAGGYPLCDECVYFKFYNQDCTHKAYERFDVAVDFGDVDDAIDAAKDMVKELEELKTSTY